MSFDSITQWLSFNSGLLLGATGETLYMVAVSGLVGFAVGIPLGVVLHITKKGGLAENTKLNGGLGAVVNIGRSVTISSPNGRYHPSNKTFSWYVYRHNSRNRPL